MVINGSCSTNMYAWQLSFNFSSMVWGGMAPWPPFGSAPGDGRLTDCVVLVKLTSTILGCIESCQ